MKLMFKIDSLSLFNRISVVLEDAFWTFWWVCLAILITLIVLEQGLKTLDFEREQLRQQHIQLQQEKEKAASLRDTLKLQINSQSDPAWVELTLKKGLGMVPEGNIKVLYID